MQAAAQGISTFASSGDNGAYDTGAYAGVPGALSLTVDTPADSPYITAAGGTTLPFALTLNGMDVGVQKERAWGWDYLAKIYSAIGVDLGPSYYLTGGGGGFSTIFPTPDYQLGVKGVNHYSAVQDFTVNQDQTEVTSFNASPDLLLNQTNQGRNVPDLAMNADSITGYSVYFTSQNGESGYVVRGGTSVVAPQLNGIAALINSADHIQVGFWNPQIYRFAQLNNSPFTPLNDSGATNDNGYYTGTPGTIYNQATGLGTPDVAKLADAFAEGSTKVEKHGSEHHKR